MAIACVLDALISDSHAEAMLMLYEIRVNNKFWTGGETSDRYSVVSSA